MRQHSITLTTSMKLILRKTICLLLLMMFKKPTDAITAKNPLIKHEGQCLFFQIAWLDIFSLTHRNVNAIIPRDQTPPHCVGGMDATENTMRVTECKVG